MTKVKKSLAEANPELAKEFDLEANYPLTPEQWSRESE